MTDLTRWPTPEQIAQVAMEDSGLEIDDPLTHRQDFLDLMADAVRLDRRQRLAHRAVSARNYAYEATMNDYSQGSISRAQRDLEDLLRDAIREGYESLDDLTTWDSEHGHWRPVIH